MKRKRKKAFVITKIKPKLVEVRPKKFFGKKILGVIFLVLGSVILTSWLFYFFLIPTFFSSPAQTPAEKVYPVQLPVKMLIPSLGIDLSIVEARVDQDQWSLAESEIYFLPGTSPFDQPENIILFGKNSQKVLGKLSSIKISDQIYLFGEERYLLFEVTETKTVLPEDESIFSATSGASLTLFSTADYFKGKRFVVKAGRLKL